MIEPDGDTSEEDKANILTGLLYAAEKRSLYMESKSYIAEFFGYIGMLVGYLLNHVYIFKIHHMNIYFMVLLSILVLIGCMFVGYILGSLIEELLKFIIGKERLEAIYEVSDKVFTIISVIIIIIIVIYISTNLIKKF